MNSDDKFDYTYSAPTEAERKEIEDIRRHYVPAEKTEDALMLLRTLDDRVKKPPMIIAIVLGVIGLLVVGLGMAMFMEWHITVWGITVSLVGIVIASVAYPVYKAILSRNTRKYGKQIIELSNQLLNDE